MRSFEALFVTEERRSERLARIAEEGRERGTDLLDPEAFVGLAETRAALRELTGIEPESSHPAVALLFHAFHLRQQGGGLVDLAESDLRALLNARPPDSWGPSAEPSAGYVRLEDGVVRTLGEEGADTCLGGFYWLTGGGRFSVLAELYDGPTGFTLVPLPALPAAVVGLWARETVREAGGDFTDPDQPADSSTIRVAVAAEILKLAALTLWARDRGSAPSASDADAEQASP